MKDPHPLDGLPPSAKLVWFILRELDAAATTATIADASFLPQRTVQRSINSLQAADLVREIPNPMQQGTPKYALARQTVVETEV